MKTLKVNILAISKPRRQLVLEWWVQSNKLKQFRRTSSRCGHCASVYANDRL